MQCRLVQYSLFWVWSQVSAFQIITNFKNSHFSKQVLTTVVICQKCMYIERNSLKIPPLHMSFKPTICFWNGVCTLFCLKGSRVKPRKKMNIWLIVVNSWDLITSFGTLLSLIPITNKTSLWLVFSTKESQLIRLEYLNDSKTNKKFEIG